MRPSSWVLGHGLICPSGAASPMFPLGGAFASVERINGIRNIQTMAD